MPVIRVQNRVDQLEPGNRLEVICSDPGVIQDIPAWCRINGHKLIGVEKSEHEIVVILEVGESE